MTRSKTLLIPFGAPIADHARETIDRLKEQGLTIVTAESCTAGLAAAALSDAPGASEYLQGGFVAYTKDQKVKALGVPSELLACKGAVCAEVAQAMAQGALARSAADLAIAITGVAGPDADEDGNPVGLVFCAAALRGGRNLARECQFGAIGRDAVRTRAVMEAMALARALACDLPARFGTKAKGGLVARPSEID